MIGDRPGLARVMKFVNNLLLAANLVTACAAFAMGAEAGIDPDAMLALDKAPRTPRRHAHPFAAAPRSSSPSARITFITVPNSGFPPGERAL